MSKVKQKTKSTREIPWLKITLIVLVVLGLIGTVIAAIRFKQHPDPTYATATIEFSFDGAAKGYAPDGEHFDVNRITSDEVLNEALAAAGLQDKYTAEQIRPQLSVSGSYPEDIVKQLMNYESLLNFSANRTLTLSEYYPTMYAVTLKNDFDRSISMDSLKTLLSEIMKAYKADFTAIHSESIGNLEISYNLADYDYPQQLTIITRLLQQSARYAAEMYEKDTTLTVNGQGFNSIYVALNNLVDSDIARLNAGITMNALTKNTARLLTQYQYEIRNLNNELAQKQDQLQKMDALIAKYDKNEIIYLSSTDNLTKIDGNSSETYDQLVSLRKGTADEITTINSSIATYQLMMNDLLKTAEKDEDASTAQAAASDTAPAGETDGATTEVEIPTMTEEEIAAAAQAAEEAARKQTAALEKSIEDLLAKRRTIMTDFAALLKAYNEKEINDLTVSVSEPRTYAQKLFSGAFIKRALRTAGPLCAVGFIVCIFCLIISHRREEKKRLSAKC